MKVNLPIIKRTTNRQLSYIIKIIPLKSLVNYETKIVYM